MSHFVLTVSLDLTKLSKVRTADDQSNKMLDSPRHHAPKSFFKKQFERYH